MEKLGVVTGLMPQGDDIKELIKVYLEMLPIYDDSSDAHLVFWFMHRVGSIQIARSNKGFNHLSNLKLCHDILGHTIQDILNYLGMFGTSSMNIDYLSGDAMGSICRCRSDDCRMRVDVRGCWLETYANDCLISRVPVFHNGGPDDNNMVKSGIEEKFFILPGQRPALLKYWINNSQTSEQEYKEHQKNLFAILTTTIATLPSVLLPLIAQY